MTSGSGAGCFWVTPCRKGGVWFPGGVSAPLPSGGFRDAVRAQGAFSPAVPSLWLQHGTLHFCGFKVLAPQVSFGPEYASEEERRGMVATWAQRLKTIWEEEPIDCSPPWYFGP